MVSCCVLVLSALALEASGGSAAGRVMRRILPYVVPHKGAIVDDVQTSFFFRGATENREPVPLGEQEAERLVVSGMHDGVFQLTVAGTTMRTGLWAPTLETVSVRVLLQSYPDGAPLEGQLARGLIGSLLDYAHAPEYAYLRDYLRPSLRNHRSIKSGTVRVSTDRVYWPGYAYNSVSVLALCGMLFFSRWPRLLIPGVRRTLRLQRGECPKCRYDFRGSTGSRCPECGSDLGDWPARLSKQ